LKQLIRCLEKTKPLMICSSLDLSPAALTVTSIAARASLRRSGRNITSRRYPTKRISLLSSIIHTRSTV
jgi:hypothetical protein